ncbi:uncharacterized protein LOC131190162 [Ahaetulla prasina]|uniref:uncharacterized protein LOC131190162 n=1 Tax=Ahaetulla prasina TaxID=499056 RepID=UPI0026471C99|nr:uncharacterized protein LOC131190162 [Ahaetulla prasina]XP_058023187.1 uncharacterized protein LOC131190162 [Ahaetulla prasina]XP_058023188.1 uncharacterized protein LOC131190162 [Ahaetulla prasina]XP_058023189.1 uncharacterized protein LOC131190162 [Ahaetulla prasina]XP_058023190.1 uncharacterized protein LOC131190162 [Ahaetulla prasina]XP_058023191.1 uncharacterized protein LOC131190162 [Ahaetulla prasina]XP_058023192.1 uncharacterized protein LOC131190162 [Ahaetulla prasina]XP_05802319
MVHSNNLELFQARNTMANIFSSLSSTCKRKLLLSQTHLLNVDRLNEVKNNWEKLGMDEGMGKCFEEVMKNFPNEPSWVMKNAQMILKGDDGKVLSFASGEKEWKISVSAGDYKFRVEAPSKSAYLARLRYRQQPLSIGRLKKVEEDLKTFGPLTPAENSCFEMVLQRFIKKTGQIQNNAQIKFIFDTDGENVEYVFVSGNGDYKMDATYSNGQPQYRELHVSSGNKLEKFSCSLPTLDVDNLREIESVLAQLDLLTDSLKSCFNHLVDNLSEFIITNNLQIDFTCSEQCLSVNAKDWQISAQSNEGKVDVTFESESWDLFLKQNKGKTHELTVAKLNEMREKVRNLTAAPRRVSDILNRAVVEFSKESSCLQKNAHLVIECDHGQMDFISGKGQNRIDIFYIGDIIYCNVSRTWLMSIVRFLLSLPKYLPNLIEIAARVVLHVL